MITVVHGRHDHLELQREGLAESSRPIANHVIVAIDDPGLGPVARRGRLPYDVVAVDGSPAGLPLALARNVGARVAIDAGADLLVFLDVDCVPSRQLIAAYERATRIVPQNLLCGPVAYLPPAPPGGYRLRRLNLMADPHPDRPSPPPGALLHDRHHYDLFWSLSFAITAAQWSRLGGFCESYRGYGAEDTDFAYVARERQCALTWVGGARAFHQHHWVSSPPIEHLEDIVRNASVFYQRWGRWPMGGWLEQFSQKGLVEWTEHSLRISGD